MAAMATSAAATPGSGVSAKLLAQGTTAKPIRVNTHGKTDVVVRQITIQPGGTTGWHYHDGRLVAVVVSGTLTHVDQSCTRRKYTARQSFLEPDGRRHVHVGSNRGRVPVVLMVTYINPEGKPLAVDAPAPACAKS
ncbi:cupin domain-containing protein [Actinomadura rubrisoli]|uniref:Cupin domain-containing protein n=2 Tax=Actinomadura rubrisoli TaxID=2530368 RepID=A0A4R5B4I3_9ACTN|nr:cupin domain-containing protein [Actinomadura rubrisoli]